MMNDSRPIFHQLFFFSIFVVVLTLLPIVNLTAVSSSQIVRIGVYENAPKIFRTGSDKPEGIFIDIIESIADSEGWRLQYVIGTWREGLERLENGDIDIMPDVAYTADRAKIFSFHNTPVLSSWFQVYTLKGSDIRTLLDLGGKRVAVLERSIQQESFEKLVGSFGLTVSLVPAPDYKTIFEMVADGKAEAAITNGFYGLRHAKNFGLEDTAIIFSPSDLFFAATKGDPGHLLGVLEKDLIKLKNDPQSIYYESLNRWISTKTRLKLPAWIMLIGAAVVTLLLASLLGSLVLKHQVNVRTRELQKLNRVLHTLGECSQALVHATDESRLLDDVCRIMVEIGEYRLTWVGIPDAGAPESVRIVSRFGIESDSSSSADMPGSHTDFRHHLTNKTLETGRPFSTRHISSHADFAPWRTEILREGYASVLVMPLMIQGEIVGTLGICSVDPLAFDSQETEHLSRLAGDLAFGIAGHRTRAALTIAENQQRDAQQRFMDIVEFLPDPTFVVDQEKKLIAWNRACEDLTGVKKGELIGRGDYAYAKPFFGEPRPILIDLLDMPEPDVEASYKYIKREGDKLFAESFIPGLGGGRGAHLWGVASPLYDQAGRRCGAIETLRDVSEQKNVEEKLVSSERKYRELVMLANSIILRWSRDGRITFMNEFGQRFFGYTESQLLGRHVIGTIVPESESTGRNLCPLMEKILADPDKFERNINENMRKSGERVWIDWTNKVIIDENNRIEEILSIGSDITDRKLAEEEICRLNDDLHRHSEMLEQRVAERTAELASAKRRAEAADRIKSAFLANMSHELRTPLNSIIGFTGILLQGLAGPLNEEQHKQLKMVQSSSRHLLALINDVLDISKIEAGQLVLSVESFELRPSIENMITLVSPQAEKKGLDIHLDIADDIANVVTDQRRLEQVLLNLLNNAVKFTQNGYVRIMCRTENDRYRLSVSDTGIGIRPKDIPGLFQPFHQIDSGITRKHEGTGLGLSICKKLLDMMDGTIDVQSQHGRGSTFTIRFPRPTGDSA